MTRIYKTPFAATGDKEALAPTDPGTGKVSLPTGWTADYEKIDTDPAYRPVGRQEMNGVLNEVTEALAEVQQFGSVAWQVLTGGWPLGAIVRHDSKAWRNTVNNNTATPNTGGSNWVEIVDGIEVGAGALQIPRNSNLGTAAYKKTGTAPEQIPTNADIALSLTPAMTASGTVALNTLTMTGIVAALGLEVGDVVRISGHSAPANNDFFTVTQIVDANQINLNKAPISSGAQTFTVTRVLKGYAAPNGVGQRWEDLTGSRTVGTTYTNTLNRAITVAITSGTASSTDSLFTVGGIAFSLTQLELDTATFTIPPGTSYFLNNNTINKWRELR